MEGPQHIYTMEHPGQKSSGHQERDLHMLESKDKPEDKNELLREAQGILLNNNDLYEKFLRGQLDNEHHSNPKELTEVLDLFVAVLQDLPDTDIDSVIRQFNMGFKRFVTDYRGSLEITPKERDRIFESDARNGRGMRGNIHAEGIKNTIRFIRARRKLLNADPSQKYAFYVESGLDMKYKIDLIECIFENEGNSVREMNLIQLKSSVPSEDEQDEITRNHADWVHSTVMDFEAFEKEYKDGIPTGLTIEELAGNADKVGELLLDLATSPEGFNPDQFIKSLDLEELPNRHRAWLLHQYGDILRENVRLASEQGLVETADAKKTLTKLDDLENRVRAKAKLTRNLSHIDSINSIVAVGPTIVREENLFSSKDKPRDKKKVIKTR